VLAINHALVIQFRLILCSVYLNLNILLISAQLLAKPTALYIGAYHIIMLKKIKKGLSQEHSLL
jgi:hypothetical protein